MKSLREALRTVDRRTATIFLVAAAVAPTWHYFLGVGTLERLLGSETGHGVLRDLLPALASFAAMFFLLAVVPALAVRHLLGDRLRDYGLGLGDVRYGVLATLATVPIFMVPIFVGGPQMGELAEFYPVSRAALASPAHFVAYEAAYLLFYASWEFHFRGFLLFGAEKAFGMWPAIGISMLASTLMHLVKPVGEFYAAIFGGLIWGWIAIRTRSIFWPLLMHYAVGVTNDLVISTNFHDFRLGS